jgi:signal transduction histidine kinase
VTARPPAAPTGSTPKRGLFRSRLRDARIRSKLGLILIIPLIAVVALAAVRLVDSGQRAFTANLVRSLALVSVEASTVAQELHTERTAALQLLSDPEPDTGRFNLQAETTDEAVARYAQIRSELGDVPDLVDDRLVRADEQLANLDELRESVLADGDLATAVLQYGGIVRDLVSYQESVAQVTVNPELAESIRAVAAWSKARAEASESAVEAFLALSDENLENDQLTPFLATLTGRQEALLAFDLSATVEQQTIANSYYTGGPATLADNAERDVLRSAGSDPVITPEAAASALGAIADTMRFAEVEFHAGQVQLATDLRDTVFRQVLVESIASLLALVIAIAIAVLLARMLARSLGQLRENALAVAERELPETVARLSDPRTLGENTPAELAAQVREPIQLRSRDEIGQVAQAFNVVHRAAVRVAAEQAALRTSVSAMFLNLARRSQSLVDRMISQLDEIERHEEDPKRLARMFTLDHLATRMRRNDENLLVLAGADSSPPRSDDALVTDVLRAAQSEVEHYGRIEFGTVDSDVSVAALAVNDTVRLVAELFDNATRFSPPDSAVVCEARRLGDQVIVQIEDRGVGMAQDQVSRLNAWLAAPPAVEVTTFRKMGLAVVARLAARHQIRVELRCDPNYGTIAYVALPRSILILPRSRLRQFEVPAPRSPMPVERAPAPPPPAAAPAATPPVPSRHLGQLPRRSPAVAHHAASRRGGRRDDATATGTPTVGNGTVGNGQVLHHDNHRADMPVAGRPLYELAAPPAPPAAAPPVPPPEATVELPIFREMETAWFRSHGDLELDRERNQREAPSAGGYPPPTTPPATASAATTPPPPASPPPPPLPTRPTGGGDGGRTDQPASYDAATESWRTAADFGWRAAAAASQPTSGGATESGLPKRVPQAQLVPGSVDPPTGAGAQQRRSPEEIRGLLSAYHRGVQRGRESGGR